MGNLDFDFEEQIIADYYYFQVEIGIINLRPVFKVIWIVVEEKQKVFEVIDFVGFTDLIVEVVVAAAAVMTFMGYYQEKYCYSDYYYSDYCYLDYYYYYFYSEYYYCY